MKAITDSTRGESSTAIHQQIQHAPVASEHDDSHRWWDQSISSCEHGLYPDFWVPDTCGTGSPPCMDPTCEDYLPCEVFPYPCNPEECYGLVCTSEKCSSDKSCSDEDCLKSRCITPGCGQECLTTPCGPLCTETVCPKDVCCEADDHHLSKCGADLPSRPPVPVLDPMITVEPSHSLEILRLACTNLIDSQPSVGKTQSSRMARELSHRTKMAGLRQDFRSVESRGEKRRNLDSDRDTSRSSNGQKRSRLCVNQTLQARDPILHITSGLEKSILYEPPNDYSDHHTCMWAEPTRFQGMTTRTPCGQRFATEEDLQNHVEKYHVEAMIQHRLMQKRLSSIHTPQLPASYSMKSSEDDLFCHWLNCTRPHPNGFTVKGKLQIHLRTHTGYKPFPCPLCPSRFKTPDALAKHTRTHTGERPYECPEPGCDRKFATPTELKTHATVHSGERPHACPICGQLFADASNLSKHKKTHREKAHMCAQCGAKFTRSDHLERHCVKLGHCLDSISRKARGKSRTSSVSTVSEPPLDTRAFVY